MDAGAFIMHRCHGITTDMVRKNELLYGACKRWVEGEDIEEFQS